jgi:hypothetical protein
MLDSEFGTEAEAHNDRLQSGQATGSLQSPGVVDRIAVRLISTHGISGAQGIFLIYTSRHGTGSGHVVPPAAMGGSGSDCRFNHGFVRVQTYLRKLVKSGRSMTRHRSSELLLMGNSRVVGNMSGYKCIVIFAVWLQQAMPESNIV